jgi:hypothetical protein
MHLTPQNDQLMHVGAPRSRLQAGSST